MSRPVSRARHRKEAAKEPSWRGRTASVSATRRAIDAALAGTEYGCKTVSWDDVSRGTVNGSLSCWGSNITDTRLKAKDGRALFTVRSDNWNEKLGFVRAEDVALLRGNCDAGDTLRNITLKQFLDDPAGCGAAYSGLEPGVKLSDVDADRKVSIRFQTVFLPVQEDVHGRGTMQFAAEAYNYATRSDSNPRNLILLATAQGLSVQADGAGAKRLLQHAGRPGAVAEYWLEAESSRHRAGGAQRETSAEREDARKRGKVTGEVLGIKAMGTRFNVLMAIQVPLLQKTMQRRVGLSSGSSSSAPTYPAKMSLEFLLSSDAESQGSNLLRQGSASHAWSRGARAMLKEGTGVASAARVSRGDFYALHKGLAVRRPRRNTADHVTVTCVLYHTVRRGVPSAADVLAAVEDMERLYKACTAAGRLKDAAFDFMKRELTVSDTVKIRNKVRTQRRTAPPPQPATAHAPRAARDVVVAKVAELQGLRKVSADKVLELRLLSLGAVEDEAVKTLLGAKFDRLKKKADGGDKEGTRAILVEIQLLIQGALS